MYNQGFTQFVCVQLMVGESLEAQRFKDKICFSEIVDK
jgi:hypothetical protein